MTNRIMVYVSIEEDSTFAYLASTGRETADHAEWAHAMYSAEFSLLDDDDEVVDTRTIYGLWSGGCYIDLTTGMDFYDGEWRQIWGASNVVNISTMTPNETYTAPKAWEGFRRWAMTTAEGEGFDSIEDAMANLDHL